ncbi:hypothetical protein CBR_g24077 [Chara braunii]|uniref:Uncharacterized protein n=1 Tax=Chara braunii TaxID=69332 RepID=A0A388L5P5_CHABU|nr:hypothetical protein CBR_g24077 [Chara braunii]|eukprot:GBG77631.1 hypothetical protein CBR_g24077 [Chara braunii]
MWCKDKASNGGTLHQQRHSPPGVSLMPLEQDLGRDRRQGPGARSCAGKNGRSLSLFGNLDSSACAVGGAVSADKVPGGRRRTGAVTARLAPLTYPLPAGATPSFESIPESEEDAFLETADTANSSGDRQGKVNVSSIPGIRTLRGSSSCAEADESRCALAPAKPLRTVETSVMLFQSGLPDALTPVPTTLPFVQDAVGHLPSCSGNAMYSPIFVELFTAQGCSSSPRADHILSRLGKVPMYATTKPQQVAVIPLAYHVDYWDCLGWNDPFASQKWTARQKKYAEKLSQRTVYTPQLVVQGQMNCVGSKADDVHNLLRWAPRYIAPDIKIDSMRVKVSSIKITMRARLLADVEGVQVLRVKVALYENGNMTSVTGGENAEKTLWNDRVVRGMQRAFSIFGVVDGTCSKGTVRFKTWPEFKQQRCGIVVFIQDPVTMRVYGCQQFAIENR